MVKLSLRQSTSDHSIDELFANHAVHLWPVIQKLTRKRHAGDGGESCPQNDGNGLRLVNVHRTHIL